MMCRKCGASIPRGAGTCPNCGAPAPDERPERRNVSRAANKKLAARIPFLLMGLAAGHIAQLVLWFCPALAIGGGGAVSGRNSLAAVLHILSRPENSGYFVFELVTVLFCALAAASVALAVMPIFRGGRGRRMRMVTSKVTAVFHAAVLVFLFAAFRAAGEDTGLPVALTAGGVSQLVLCAAVFALTMVISFASKQKKVDRL